MKPANNAPMYAMVYAKLAEIAREHGYAMAVHGTLARDFDLICVPWTEDPAEPQVIVDEITSRFTLRVIDSPELKLHSRLCYTLSFGGDVFLDLSFMPRAAQPPGDGQ